MWWQTDVVAPQADLSVKPSGREAAGDSWRCQLVNCCPHNCLCFCGPGTTLQCRWVGCSLVFLQVRASVHTSVHGLESNSVGWSVYTSGYSAVGGSHGDIQEDRQKHQPGDWPVQLNCQRNSNLDVHSLNISQLDIVTCVLHCLRAHEYCIKNIM